MTRKPEKTRPGLMREATRIPDGYRIEEDQGPLGTMLTAYAPDGSVIASVGGGNAKMHKFRAEAHVFEHYGRRCWKERKAGADRTVTP